MIRVVTPVKGRRIASAGKIATNRRAIARRAITNQVRDPATAAAELTAGETGSVRM